MCRDYLKNMTNTQLVQEYKMYSNVEALKEIERRDNPQLFFEFPKHTPGNNVNEWSEGYESGYKVGYKDGVKSGQQMGFKQGLKEVFTESEDNEKS